MLTGSTEPLGDVIECSASSPYYSGNIVGSMPVGDVTSQSAHHFQVGGYIFSSDYLAYFLQQSHTDDECKQSNDA
jgi:hypothetical protein